MVAGATTVVSVCMILIHKLQLQWHQIRHQFHRSYAGHSEAATIWWVPRSVDAIHGLQEPTQGVASIQHGAPIKGGRNMWNGRENCKNTIQVTPKINNINVNMEKSNSIICIWVLVQFISNMRVKKFRFFTKKGAMCLLKI